MDYPFLISLFSVRLFPLFSYQKHVGHTHLSPGHL